MTTEQSRREEDSTDTGPTGADHGTDDPEARGGTSADAGSASTTDTDQGDEQLSVKSISRRGALGVLAGLGLLGAASQPASAHHSGHDHLGETWTGDPGTHGLQVDVGSNTRFGLLGFTDDTDGRGVVGRATASSGRTIGVIGRSDSSSDGAAGLQGFNDASSGRTYGFRGRSDSTDGRGALGIATADSGNTIGLEGRADSPDGVAISGTNTAASGETIGVQGQVASPDGYGLMTPHDAKIEGSLQFTSGAEPHQFIFESGTSNPDQNVISHSPGFPDWGLRYDDDVDDFVFQSGGIDDVTVSLAGTPTLDVSGDARVEGSLQFTSGAEPHQFIFESGTSNPDQNVISHSPGFPDWGLRYDDVGDNFVFQSGGIDDVTVSLAGTPTLHALGTVAANASGPSAHVAAVENRSTSSNGDVLFLRTNTSDPGSSNNFITFFDADGGVGAVEGNGAGGVNYKSGAADIAEYFPAADPDAGFEAGDVVGLAGGELVANPTDGDRALVVSDSPMLTGNAPEYRDDVGDDGVCAALLGQIPVRVGAPVEAGDLLVATPEGTAVPADGNRIDADALVIGRALDGTSQADGTVDAFVTAAGTVEQHRAREDDGVDALEARAEELERTNERLRRRVEAVQAENEALEAKLASLEDRIASIEAGAEPRAPADD